ncbi:MAG: hypothetical protein L3K08_08725, partial [Thermoplasmata archaeon]|nr:hypothetical protein [Thermoplasmata archaeon]
LVSSSDGFLYDFAVGGGNDAILPTTTVSSPPNGAAVANPNGNLVATGTALDPHGLAGVIVAVQSGGTNGPWWSAAASRWVAGPMGNSAPLNRTAHGTSGSWMFSFPVPRAGGTFHLTAYAVAARGQSDLRGADSGFSVNFSTTGPHLRASSTYVAPGGTLSVTGGGFGRLANVSILLSGLTVATSRTTSTGYLPWVAVTIPLNTPFGLTSLNATNLPSGRSATVAIVVQNSWD